MRILCVSAPLSGHLDWGGYLSTALALQQRRHTVLWASGNAVEKTLQQVEIPFHALAETGWRWPPPPALTASKVEATEEWQRLRGQRALDQWLDEARVQNAVDEMFELIQRWQPDSLLSEMFIAAAGIAAEIAQIPLIVAGWPAQPIQLTRSDPIVIEARQRLDRLLARFAVEGRNWSTTGPPALLSPDLHISYWNQRWFDGVAMLDQTRHVGGIAAPAEPPDPTLPAPDERPWMLITLGTSFGNDANFFIAASHAVARLGCLPLLALGNQITGTGLANLVTKLPSAAIVRQHWHFPALLPYLAAAIHHGGAGTTHALVTHAVPQIVIPHAADQQRQAHGVMRSGVGLAFAAKDVTIDLLEAALAEILPDLSLARTNAHQLRDEFAELGGVEVAANLVEMKGKQL